MTKDAFRRCILDALAEGCSYDAFRTALRIKLRALEAEAATDAEKAAEAARHDSAFVDECSRLAGRITAGTMGPAAFETLKRDFRLNPKTALIVRQFVWRDASDLAIEEGAAIVADAIARRDAAEVKTPQGGLPITASLPAPKAPPWPAPPEIKTRQDDPPIPARDAGAPPVTWVEAVLALLGFPAQERK